MGWPGVSDSVFLDCWHVLNEMGWHSFTFDGVSARYPQWDRDKIFQLFPTKHHLILGFSQRIPPVKGQFHSPQEGIFDAVMTRLDALWSYRAVLGPGFLDMPLDVVQTMMGMLIRWFYGYWASVASDKEFVNGMPRGLGALISFAIYGAIFPYAMTHGYDETLARLDYWCTRVISWVEQGILGL
jgi:hypothetical protein